MLERGTFIYAMVDSRESDHIRCIDKTKVSLKVRLKRHIAHKFKKLSELYRLKIKEGTRRQREHKECEA